MTQAATSASAGSSEESDAATGSTGSTDGAATAGTTQVVNRIKRAQGQLSGVLRMLEEGRDLQEVVNQLKAVSRALDRAGFAIIAAQLRESARSGSVSDEELDALERIFLSLA